MLDVRVVRFGAPATRALAEVIAAAKRDDQMAPVTVLVARSRVGLATRRWLAAGDFDELSGSARGVVNVSFTTIAGFAAQISEFALSADDRLPATKAMRNAAARHALRNATESLFSSVSEHPGTVRALVRAYDELRSAPETTLAGIAAQSERAREVVGLIASMRGRLERWYDETDVLVAATGSLAAHERRLELPSSVVVYLPRSLSGPERALLEALSARCAVTVLVGATGDHDADTSARKLLGDFGAGTDYEAFRTAREVGTKVVSAPSADVEVLCAMRTLMAHQRTGIPLERMAIAFSSIGPYRRIVREALTQAGIPFNGTGVRTLASTVAGRVLLGLFELADHGWQRDELMGWLASAPLRDGDRKVPATRWDRLSRRAGVIGGLDAWAEHLDGYAAELRGKIAERDDDAERAQQGRHRDLDEVDALKAFIDGLAGRFDVPPDSWADWSAWCGEVLTVYLGSAARRSTWPADEAEAFIAVSEILNQLTVLDDVDSGPSLGVFRAALAAELEGLAPQTTRFANGVMIGSVPEMLGLDLDLILVLGMHDGSLPPRRTDDPLVRDSERLAADPELPLRSARVVDAHRDYLAALAAAPERVLSFARGDQSQGREQRPSRWLLSTLAFLTAPAGAQRTLYSRDLEGLPRGEHFQVIESLTQAVREIDEPCSLADRDLHELLSWHEIGQPMTRHYLSTLDPVLDLGFEARAARRSRRFTRFDGHVAGLDVRSPTDEIVISASSLEAYATCPRRYFFSRQLDLRARESPEEILEIGAADRGSLMHEILERFFGEELDRAAEQRLTPAMPWGDTASVRLLEIANEVFATYEQQGLTGRPLTWRFNRRRIEHDLVNFLEEDSAFRAEWGSTPIAVELAFGDATGNPVSVSLPEGRRVSFRGKADRVDAANDGAVVIDYKTGSRRSYDAIGRDDWFVRGTKLQLPIYALAARDRLGDVDVTALYWFVGDGGDPVDVPMDNEVQAQFSGVLSTLVDGIESGFFPGRPGEEQNEDYKNCTYCDFKEICPTDRARAWTRKREDQTLRDYVALSEGAPPS